MVSHEPSGQLLTIEEAAERFRVSSSTLYRWCRAGRIPAFKIGRGWLIPADPVTGRTARRHDALRQFLARTFGPRARRAGQHWLIASENRRDHLELRSAIEEFVLSRRKTRFGRLVWEEGPALTSSVDDKPGGFDIRIQAPLDAIHSPQLAEVILGALHPQSGRAAATYLLAESALESTREKFAVIAESDKALGGLARDLRMVVFSNLLLPQDLGWTEMMALARNYDGTMCYANGHLYAAQSDSIETPA